MPLKKSKGEHGAEIKISVKQRGFHLFLIPLIIHILILYYMFKLDVNKCECSNNWRKVYIQLYLIISTITWLFMPLYENYYSLQFLLVIGGIVNIYAIYTYMEKIEHCHCARTGSLNTLYKFVKYYNYVQIGLLSLSIIMHVIWGIYYYNSKKTN